MAEFHFGNLISVSLYLNNAIIPQFLQLKEKETLRWSVEATGVKLCLLGFKSTLRDMTRKNGDALW
jgi:hypothetical protein